MEKKIALLFPGYGNQFLGVGELLYKSYVEIRETFEEASDVLKLDLKKIAFELSLNELNKIENLWPFLLSISCGLFKVYQKEIGISPMLIAGHSMGEYSALTCSGSIKFEDTLKILRSRALLFKSMENSDIKTIIVNNIDVLIIQELLNQINSDDRNNLYISSLNTNRQMVIVGGGDKIMKAEMRIREFGGQVTPLYYSYTPSHTPYMSPILEEYSKILENIEFKEFQYPVLSNIDAKPHLLSELKSNLILHNTNTVKWFMCLNYIINSEAEIVIELGPQTTLIDMLGSITKSIKTFSFSSLNNRDAMVSYLRHGSQSKDILFINHCLNLIASSPNLPNIDTCSMIAEQYTRLLSIKKQLESGDIIIRKEQKQELIKDMSILMEKKNISNFEKRLFLKEVSLYVN